MILFKNKAGGGAGGAAWGGITGTLADQTDLSLVLTALINNKVETTDPRLSDARTPSAHKTSHATGGGDALTPGDIGAQAALGFTPENTANKGAANGYAGLDAGGKVPAAQLPSIGGFPAALYDNGSKGTAFNFDVANGEYQKVVFTASLAAGIANPADTAKVSHLMVMISQDATGSRAWSNLNSADVDCGLGSNVSPTLSATASIMDIFDFYWSPVKSKWELHNAIYARA